ncbi:aminotransferase class IV [Urechidicola vernalis]|uniref:Aminotransferase class IV n=1 Tax=Urechidicola vernalis TaxID=3075600 RepID=A0ABU2Y2G1_9FLAO|nr:aminotransferase class IV [Urechidicola sp. P050]MDT0551970.1 aminotransferase class IV [Urechidicola sp. P050]
MNFPEKVSLNGEILNTQEAKISVFDRGFLFGDGIYEVMIQLNGKLFHEQAHLDRMKYSLQEIDLNYDVNQLKDKVKELLKANDLIGIDCLIYMQITRGTAPRKHSFPIDIEPTCLLYALPKEFPKINNSSYNVVTQNDFRWTKCHIKMTSLLGNVLANQFAAENDAYETLLIRAGIFTEASHCNVFFVKKGVVYTHPANEFILNGITRQLVVKLCNDLNIELREEGYPVNLIEEIDEAFLTGTTTQVGVIGKIDNQVLPNRESAGPITKRLQQAFSELL